MVTSRRQWLKQSSFAALGLSFSLKSLAGEDYLPRSFGSDEDLINLGSNENPYGISSKAKQAILDMMGQTNRYQFNIASLQSFKKTIAEHNGVSAEQVMITAGSGDGLNLLARHFSKGNIVTASPTFGILPNTAKKIGTSVIEIPLNYDKVHDLDAMQKAINADTSLVYICNPANPSSTIIKREALKNFCTEAAKKTVVLIDEAYVDFLDDPEQESMAGLIEKNPNVLVIKTFSKIHAMAGLRIGFVIGHASLIRKIEPDYFQNTQLTVSVLSANAAMASLTDKEHCMQSKLKNATARKYTYDELTKMKFRCIPSYTNFLFFHLTNYNGDFAAEMMKKNILLRSTGYSDGQWCRVSVGTMEEMKQFIAVMKKTFPS
jgi:histidinol-phosphate aminotransferase